MTSQWEEEGLDLDDFDETAFMNYNGHLRQGTDTAVGSGIGDTENWGGMQRDWEEFQRSEPTLRGAGEVNPYLFQSRNPYASMAGDADMGRDSPTLKVSYGTRDREKELMCRVYSSWREQCNMTHQITKHGTPLVSNNKRMSGRIKRFGHYRK
jgi:hypothetical protein